MGLNGSIEGSNPSFSASAAPAAVLRPPAEGWQSGRMRRSRKPLSVVRRIEGSNPSPSAQLPRMQLLERDSPVLSEYSTGLRTSAGHRSAPLDSGATWRAHGAHPTADLGELLPLDGS